MAYRTALIGLLLGVSNVVAASGDQWYVGVGGGASLLQPNAEQGGISVDDDIGESATVYFGRDFDTRSSGQFQLYSLGDATFDNGGEASYFAGDASLLYRFFDTRDGRRGAISGTSIYGRFGFGFIERDSSEELDDNARVYFGAGAGIESYFTTNLGIRLEAFYHDTDAASATLSLVTRFGGRRRATAGPGPALTNTAPTFPEPVSDIQTNPAPRPQARPITPPQTEALPLPESGQLPETLPLPETPPSPLPSPAVIPTPLPAAVPSISPDQTPAEDWTEEFPEVELFGENESGNNATPAETPTETATETPTGTPLQTPESNSFGVDSDNDGISDSLDQCPRSSAGYPVDASGCSSFSSIARLLTFNTGSALLTPSALLALDELAILLNQFPAARIELIAHTDASGTEQEQSNLARQRLRSLGVHLVGQGISQDRLLLRSFGGNRPVFDNSTAEGRQRNNRIEVFENP